MVFGQPVAQAVYHELTVHCTLGGSLVSAAASVGWDTRGVVSIVVVGDDLVQRGIDVIGVVVHDIHDNTKSGVVKALDHPLEFRDPDFTVVGIRAVAAFGYVVVLGVIAPVELRLVQTGLVDGSIVVDRLQMHMGDSQILQVIDAYGDSVRVLQTGLRECKILSGVGGICDFVGEIADMHFPDDRIAVALESHIAVIFKTCGVCGVKIQNHAAVAVHARCPGIGVDRFLCSRCRADKVCVIGSAAAGIQCAPDAFGLLLHGNLREGFAAVAVLVQAEDNFAGSGGPDLELGFPVCKDGGSQVISVIGVVVDEGL